MAKTKPINTSLIGTKTNGGSTVLRYIETRKDYRRIWELKCVCGDLFLCNEHNFTKFQKLCYCKKCRDKIANIKKRKINLEGSKIGRWFVLIESNLRDTNCHIFYECVCECGTIKRVNSDSLSREESKSCGCLAKEIVSKMSKERCGEKHYRWNGGIRKKRESRKIDPRLPPLLKKIYKRDDYCCFICKSKIKINAHHMDGWKWCLNRRYDESNLITLCHIHHKEFHREYGSGSNTQRQFEEYCIRFDLNPIEYIKVRNR